MKKWWSMLLMFYGAFLMLMLLDVLAFHENPADVETNNMIMAWVVLWITHTSNKEK